MVPRPLPSEDTPKAVFLAVLVALGLWFATATLGERQVARQHARHWGVLPVNGEAVALAPFLVRASINGGQVEAEYLWACGIDIRLTPDEEVGRLETLEARAGQSGMSVVGDRSLVYSVGTDSPAFIVVTDSRSIEGSSWSSRSDWTSYTATLADGRFGLEWNDEHLRIDGTQYRLHDGRVFCLHWEAGESSSRQLDIELRKVLTTEHPGTDHLFEAELERVERDPRVRATMEELRGG